MRVMQNPLNEFRRLKSEKANKEAEDSREARRAEKIRNEEKEHLFQLLCKNISHFDEEEVDGRILNVKKGNDWVELHVDGRLYLTFTVTTSWSYCSCENVCEHKPTYTHRVNVKNKNGGYVSFYCNTDSDFEREGSFARSMLEVMEKYRE